MVLVWGYLARGNDGHTLVMVAINSLTMLVLYGILGGFLLRVGRLPVSWQALLLSIGVYVALPPVAGYCSRRWIVATKGLDWFNGRFLHILTPVTIIALLLTLVLLFSFKGGVILSNPLTILWIAIPLFIQTMLIFGLGFGLARILGLSYEDAAPSAMIGASNHFEVAIATAHSVVINRVSDDPLRRAGGKKVHYLLVFCRNPFILGTFRMDFGMDRMRPEKEDRRDLPRSSSTRD